MSTARHAAGTVPAIETERLLLRGHGVEDFADCLALWTDPAVTRFIGGKPSTPEEVWARLLRYVGHWSLLGFGYWVVTERVTGRFLGEVGFADFRREIEPSLEGVPEIGWVLTPQGHGRGFATEAAGAALAWGTRSSAACARPASSRPRTQPRSAWPRNAATASSAAPPTRTGRRSCSSGKAANLPPRHPRR